MDVCVVEDDEGMRVAMTRVLEAAGFTARSYIAAEALLDATDVRAPICFVIDINLPGISGLELVARLVKSQRAAPFILITGCDEVKKTVAARWRRVRWPSRPNRFSDVP